MYGDTSQIRLKTNFDTFIIKYAKELYTWISHDYDS